MPPLDGGASAGASLAGGSALKKPDGTCVVDEDDPDVNPEPAQVRHLRQYSNYLTPRLGVLRPDTATLAATYIRNLLINWLVLGPTILGLALFRLPLGGLPYRIHLTLRPLAFLLRFA